MAHAIWKGHLSFGLITIPISLQAAARGERISFNQLHKHDNSRIKMVKYCALEDKPIPASEIVKGYEYEKDRYLVIEDEEIKKVAPPSAKVMEILEFVKADEVDPVYLESSYYLAPDEAGEKPYALFFEALKRSGFYGLAKLTMSAREHVVILRPGKAGLMAHTMYYADEVRQVDEFRTDTSVVTDKELNLAMMLINTLAGGFEPQKYKDNYRENVRAMIEAKMKGEKVVEMPSPAPAKVVDILSALQASLDRAKKPAAHAGTAAGGQVAEISEAVAEAPAAKPKRQRRKVG
ncbi:MAG TPA: Ku protein [Solibacterales bacterium]|nr:Ku protein [Bryobacterales bacterium]